jgi:hypothetical protein
MADLLVNPLINTEDVTKLGAAGQQMGSWLSNYRLYEYVDYDQFYENKYFVYTKYFDFQN